MPDEKVCFVICPIGEPGSVTRKRADQLLGHIIGPAVEPLGYHVKRADFIADPGVIPDQITSHVKNCALVVADLTDHNSNVFYELGIRHSTQKPVVQMIATGQKIPFDVSVIRTVFFDISDPDSVEKARTDLMGFVQSIETKPVEIDVAISRAASLKILQEQPNPGSRNRKQIRRDDLRRLEAMLEITLAVYSRTIVRKAGDALDPELITDAESEVRGNLRNLLSESQ